MYIVTVVIKQYLIGIIIYTFFSYAYGKNCTASIDKQIGSSLYWEEIPGGETAYQPCPSGASGQVSRTCQLLPGTETAVWESADVTGCSNDQLARLWATAAKEIDNNSPFTQHLITFLDSLTSITTDAAVNHILYPPDLHQSINQMYQVAAKSSSMRGASTHINKFTQSYAEAISSLCDNETADTWKNFNNETIVSKYSLDMIEAVETMATNILFLTSVHQNSFTGNSKNLNFDITLPYELPQSAADPHSLVDETTLFNKRNGNRNVTECPVTEVVMSEFAEEYTNPVPLQYRMVSPDGYSTIIYTEDIINITKQVPSLISDAKAFYRAEYSTLSELLHMDNNKSVHKLPVASRILSARVLNVNQSYFKNLSVPVIIILKHKEDMVVDLDETGCYFLNESAVLHLSENDLWNSEGCVVADRNSTHTTCHCYHLTNFALIMDFFKMNISAGHEKALSYISYIGGSLSVLSCTTSIIIYEVLKLKNERIRVHEMLALSIILSQMLFFIGFERTENEAVCRTMAILLHYVITAMFCWMLVEGIHLYISLVKVFRKKNHFRNYLSLGWGIPAANVMISVAIFLDEYAANEYCWLSVKLLISGFVPFVGLTIVANTVVLIMVLRVILKSVKTRNKDIASAKIGFKATVILLPLLGLTWIFGFMSVGMGGTLVFTYAFTICNSLQGVLFFMFHCLLNADVRQAFRRKYLKKHHGHSPLTYNSQEGGVSTLSTHVIEGDSVRKAIAYQKRPSSITSTDSSYTNQTNVDSSETGSRDEFILSIDDDKLEFTSKWDKNKYNTQAHDRESTLGISCTSNEKNKSNSKHEATTRKDKPKKCQYKKGRSVTRQAPVKKKRPQTPPVSKKHVVDQEVVGELGNKDHKEWIKAVDKQSNDQLLERNKRDEHFVIHI